MNDMIGQVIAALRLHPEITWTDRLNIHFARMGEPTWNPAVIETAQWFHRALTYFDYRVHPVVSTMMPKNNKNLAWFLRSWLDVKHWPYLGEAGLQLSINSTDDNQRNRMFRGSALSLENIGKVMQNIIGWRKLKGRKIALNFAIADDTIINADKLLGYFSPEWYMCKLTPMHVTRACERNNITTTDGYSAYAPYQKHEKALKAAGFDVLVFVPSLEEDQGRITCGNAILSGTEPTCQWQEIK